MWLDPNCVKLRERVNVYFQSSPYLRFNREKCTLKGSQRCLVKARRIGKDPILAEVVANPDNGWEYFSRTVSFGFSGEMKTEPLKEIRSGQVKPFSLQFYDDHGKKTSLKAPTTLRLIGSNARLREIGDKTWPDQPLNIPLQTGVNATPLIEVTPDSKSGGEGRIQAELTSDDKYVILSSTDITFTAPPTEWLIFTMAILGGLLHAIYELASGLVSKDKTLKSSLPVAGAKAIIGILSGIIAVLFAEKVGLKFDPTSLSGYVALGFLVSYIGVDTVLKKA
ncbi:MAG TPA: hypothetical protein VFP59_16830 [Candidatus Angelobacter sp.]|nr:hypothetical protein [Candidatus Angelobacter sp.]